MAKVAAFFAVALSALAALGWIAPSLMGAVATWAMLVGFVVVFLGMAVIVIGEVTITHRPGWLQRDWDIPSFLSQMPFRLKVTLGVSAGVAVVSAVVGLAATSGYSQNPRSRDQHCQWSIGTNHGLTNICVSHARWVATGSGFERVFLGFLAVFVAIECAILTSQVIRAPAR